MRLRSLIRTESSSTVISWQHQEAAVTITEAWGLGHRNQLPTWGTVRMPSAAASHLSEQAKSSLGLVHHKRISNIFAPEAPSSWKKAAYGKNPSLVPIKAFLFPKACRSLTRDRRTSDLLEFSFPPGDLLARYCCYLLLPDSISPHLRWWCLREGINSWDAPRGIVPTSWTH